jgi:hypothetical protein
VVKHLDRIGTHLHRRTDFVHIPGLLVHANAVAILQQTGSGRETANASSYESDIHGIDPQ